MSNNTLPPIPPQEPIDYDAPKSDDDTSLLVVYLVITVVAGVLGSLGYIVWNVMQWK